MSTLERPYLRLHRAPSPLATYLRPLERDYRHTAELISAGFEVGSGVVVDACHPDRSADLRASALEHLVEVVLDPRSLDLSTDGGVERSGVVDLPWSTGGVDHPGSFGPRRIDGYAGALARSVVQLGATAVLAPTHYLEDALSGWLDIDVALTRRLRAKLDSEPAGRSVRIFYPLASNFAALQAEPFRLRLDQQLQALAADDIVDAVWLRMNNFGTNSAGPLTIPRYVSLARRLHALGVPIIAERTGTVGIALLALGSVTGIESGITHGERFNIRDLRVVDGAASGGYAPRVYLPSLGVFLKRDQAAELLNTRGMRGSFGCQSRCCPRGVPDMLTDPRRHFVVNRASEVNRLAAVPQGMRTEQYFATWLRFAADRATRAALVLPGLEAHRRRLDMWRATLAAQVERDLVAPPTLSPPIGIGSHRGIDAMGSS